MAKQAMAAAGLRVIDGSDGVLELIEESPAPVLDPDERARTLEASVRAATSIG